MTLKYSDNKANLLGEHLFAFLVAEDNLMDGVALSLEGFEVAFDVGREEDLWVPIKPLR